MAQVGFMCYFGCKGCSYSDRHLTDIFREGFPESQKNTTCNCRPIVRTRPPNREGARNYGNRLFVEKMIRGIIVHSEALLFTRCRKMWQVMDGGITNLKFIQFWVPNLPFFTQI